MMRVKSLTQTLRVYFSNKPKVIPKPQSIQFDFKIPKKTIQPKSQNQTNQIRITKVKRNDLSKLLKKKKQNQEYKKNIQDSYQQNYENKIKQNQKVTNYHRQQYFKGQTYLQNIPLDPYYSYKLADFQRKLQLQKQRFKQFLGSPIDYEQKAQMKNKMAELYHQKQQKYQIQQFLRYLDEYPGSPKGPKPQDDLQYYVQYINKKIPAVLAHEIASKTFKTKKVIKNQNNLNDLQHFKLKPQGNYSNMLSHNRSLVPQQVEYDSQSQHDEQSKFPILKNYEQVPEFPQVQFNHYQQWMNNRQNWLNFRNFYVEKNGTEVLIKQFQYLNKVAEQNDPNPDSQYIQFTPKAPSLLRYYKTLPKQVQDHPGVKTIYLGLQFYCNYYSYEQKQQALNMAAAMTRPLDKVSVRAMSDFIQKKKHYITPFMVDKIFNIGAQFTWDINQFFAQIKRQQLKGQSMIKQNETSYPEPPQVHLQWEQGAPNLPVDYYQNDDGFWDQIISAKLKRQDQAKPIMRHRKHFTH